MNPDRTIAVCAIVATVTASVIGGLFTIVLGMILSQIKDLAARVGALEQAFISRGIDVSGADSRRKAHG